MTEDAIIIGGGFAGLSAALQLARARRRVTVIDTGEPRNRFAAHAHGFLAQDGRPGRDILADARRQLAAYETVTFRDAPAERLDGERDAFTVVTGDGGRIEGRRVLLATGFEDRLPAIPGLAVFHGPRAHGRHSGRIATAATASHPQGQGQSKTQHQAIIENTHGASGIAPSNEEIEIPHRIKYSRQQPTDNPP